MQNSLELYKEEYEEFMRMLAQYRFGENIELPAEKLDQWKNDLDEQELHIKELQKTVEECDIIELDGNNAMPTKAYSPAIALTYTGAL